MIWLAFLFGCLCADVTAKDDSQQIFSQSLTRLPSGHKKWKKRDSIDDFFLDCAMLNSLENSTDVLSKTHWKRDSSYTKSWSIDDWKSHQVRPFNRYAAHLKSWIFSPTFISVLPVIAASALWALFCIVAVSRSPSAQEFIRKAPFSSSISSFTSPISILLALKTNRALNRLLEARSAFGIFIRVTTALAGMTINYVYLPLDKDIGILMGRYLAAYGWCMKAQLRNEDDAIVLQTLLPPEESAWVISQQDSPSAIVFRLRSVIASLAKRKKLATYVCKSMEDRLTELERAMGVCKRINSSPIPPTFTRMTSRVLCMFLFFLPLALVSTTGMSPFAILLIVIFLSYIFVGIDEIGVEVENPFPLLPMFTLSSILEEKVADQFAMFQDMPKIKYK
jgi:putative membrane protein